MMDQNLIPSYGSRRTFLAKAGLAAAAFAVPRITTARDAGESEFPPFDVAALFEAGSPEVLALAKRVMEKCVLENKAIHAAHRVHLDHSRRTSLISAMRSGKPPTTSTTRMA